MGGTEIVRGPREESRYGAAAVHAGLSVWTVAMSVVLLVRAATIHAGLSVQEGTFPERQVSPTGIGGRTGGRT